jgi:DNA modification methylase
MINKIHNEPCLETLKKMPNDFLDCVISSPPYWQLRDYGYDGQWGLEPTFQQYLEHLWEMMDEIYRVLKPSGTCWINLGDTYNSGGNTRSNKDGQKEGAISHEYLENTGFTKTDIKLNGKPKCLLLIPHRFAIGCIDRGWIVRNDIIWAKRNCMPESTKDRFSKKHEYIFLMVKNEKYSFDLDAIRDEHKWAKDKRNDGKRHEYKEDAKSQNDIKVGTNAVSFNPKGKNPGDVSDFWDITTKPSSVKHYATYNVELITKPILAGCPEGGLIYDPFMGSGTTAIHAIINNRNFIGSEMSSDYLEIANKRISEVLAKPRLF